MTSTQDMRDLTTQCQARYRATNDPEQDESIEETKNPNLLNFVYNYDMFDLHRSLNFVVTLRLGGDPL